MEHRCLSPWKGAVAGGLIASAVGAAFGSMSDEPALGVAARAIAAFFWTWILGKIPGLRLKDAALYGLFFGICVAALGPLTAARAAEAVVAWTLASMVLSRCYAAACALPKP